ncbi:twin-arginine translocase TatA/TatE family subunit [Mailhella sp.]|uniref:twin-arginine translocase TatA/TatE family subunit n=1 Tax=Mailhella sp. TaxID=1981029 RepID=UPI00406397DE
MFGLGTHEILLILLLCLVVFGAKRLPEIGGGLGRAIRNFKSGVTEPDQIDLNAKDKKTEKSKEDEQA